MYSSRTTRGKLEWTVDPSLQADLSGTHNSFLNNFMGFIDIYDEYSISPAMSFESLKI